MSDCDLEMYSSVDLQAACVMHVAVHFVFILYSAPLMHVGVHFVFILYSSSLMQDGLVSRASSDSRLVSQLSSATSLGRLDSAELPQLTEPEMIHKVVKKIKAMYGSCSTGESTDVIHMLGSIQVIT